VLASKTKIWFHINFDGGSRGNPGLSGAGAEVITRRIFSKEEESKGVVKRTKAQIRKYLGNAQTNNQAEYEGAISGLEHARNVLVDLLEEKEPPLNVTLVLQGDSNLIIEQLNGNYKCNSPKLQPLYKKAKKLIADIEKSAATMDATYEHVYRKYNATADGTLRFE
jgi:ribonuclease HI